MLRRAALGIICISVSLSLSSGTLLLGQFVAWANMAKEASSSGNATASMSQSVLELELCGVCLVIREEHREQSESEALGDKREASPLLLVVDRGDFKIPRQSAFLQPIGWSLERLPMGFIGEVAKPPPRLEV